MGLLVRLRVVTVVSVMAAMLLPAVTARAAETSIVPTNEAGAVVWSGFGPAGLSWFHTCPGDYNQDGLVSGSDITPFGIYFDWASTGETFPDDVILSLIDGNGDGVITAADITPVGVNYGRDVLGGYNLYASDDPADYPDDGGQATKPGAVLLTSVTLADTITEPGETRNYLNQQVLVRKRFRYPLEDPTIYYYYWVRPVDGLGNEGSPSEIWKNPGVSVTRLAQSAAVADWLGGSTLRWYYYNHGDYNLDRMVTISDMNKVTQLFQTVASSDPNTETGMIDTDGSGVIDTGDIEAIEVNYDKIICGYNVYHSMEAGDYPATNDERSNIEPVASIGYDGTNFTGDPYRPVFTVDVPGASAGSYLWVRPYDHYGWEGTPSNLVVVE